MDPEAQWEQATDLVARRRNAKDWTAVSLLIGRGSPKRDDSLARMLVGGLLGGATGAGVGLMSAGDVFPVSEYLKIPEVCHVCGVYEPTHTVNVDQTYTTHNSLNMRIA